MAQYITCAPLCRAAVAASSRMAGPPDDGILAHVNWKMASKATGHGPEKFAHLPWLKVTGKEPPWA